METIYVRGENGIAINTLLSIREALANAGINCSYKFSIHDYVYWFEDGTIKRALIDSETARNITRNRTEVSLGSFIDIINDHNQTIPERWFDTLQVGDVVTIAERLGDESDYPFGFVDEMTDYVGQSFTIIEIRKNFCLEDEMNCHYYNGDNNCYVLDKVSYNWHSSMFVPPKNIQSIKKIELTDIDISL